MKRVMTSTQKIARAARLIQAGGLWLVSYGFLMASATNPACVPIDGDRILGRHLAAADPQFASIIPDAELGYAPRSGVTRLFRIDEQSRIARRFKIEPAGQFSDVCFIGAGAFVRDGSPLTERDIKRGDRVTVEVTSGSARLVFEAEAASAGRFGDSVLVKNPENGRLFQARVQGKRKVTIQK
jgi:flagella basal body P-ring formation protein FlgA